MDFRTAHAAATAKEGRWLRVLDGPASDNRLYTDPAGNRIVVFNTCLPHRCGEFQAMGAYHLATKIYGLEVVERGQHRTLGTLPPAAQRALACARHYDATLRSEAAAAIRRFGDKLSSDN